MYIVAPDRRESEKKLKRNDTIGLDKGKTEQYL